MRWATAGGNWRGAKVLLRCWDKSSGAAFGDVVTLRSAGGCAAFGVLINRECHRDEIQNLLAYAVETREREWK